MESVVSAEETVCPFAEKLRDILTTERRGFADELAFRLNMKRANLDARLYGRSRFSLVQMRQVLAHLPDKRLADCLLEGTPFRADARPSQVDLGKSLAERVKQAHFDAGDLHRVIDRALEDGKLTRAERQAISRVLMRAEADLVAVRQRIESDDIA